MSGLADGASVYNDTDTSFENSIASVGSVNTYIYIYIFKCSLTNVAIISLYQGPKKKKKKTSNHCLTI